MTMQHLFRRKPLINVLSRALAVTALYLPLPLLGAGAVLLTPLSAIAQEYPEEYDWPSSESRATGIKMPPRTIRLASGMTAYPQGVVEKMVGIGKTAGMTVERREEFFWSGLTPVQLKSERDIVVKNLTAAGYSVKPMGEASHPDEKIFFFLAQKKGATGGNGTIPGFWSVGKTFQALVMGAAPGVLGKKAVPKVYTAKEKQGFALIDAVEESRVDEVKSLLAQGVDPNSRSKIGQTPLMRAALNNRTDIAEILLKAGADPNLGTDSMNPLQLAAMGQHTDLMALLLRYKANINLVNAEYGITALHVAAMLGKERSVDFLLENGADPSIRAKSDGRTARELAVRGNHTAIAEKLRAAEEKP